MDVFIRIKFYGILFFTEISLMSTSFVYGFDTLLVYKSSFVYKSYD